MVPKETMEKRIETPSVSHKDSIFPPPSTSSSSWHEFSVFWAANLTLLKNNTYFHFFRHTVYEAFNSTTPCVSINKALERMSLLCHGFLSQKSHVFPWDFLSRYVNGREIKLHDKQTHLHLHSAQGSFNAHIKYNYAFTACSTFRSQMHENIKNYHKN